jgi:hypothetical protein
MLKLKIKSEKLKIKELKNTGMTLYFFGFTIDASS